MITVHMIGNAHIDPVWLWPWQAGVDEALATVRSAVDRCDEYPEFIFTRGEAWIYRQIELLDPDLFQRVRELVARGQWHITGGQWMQPDVNLPTWEGLRRHIFHGRRYFQDRFGVTPDVCFNVDSFGHPATLPDLLATEHYIGYVCHRPSQQQVELPAATFRWRGVGGGEVLCFRIPAAYTTRADDLYGQIMLSLDAADEAVGHVMCFYGVGNHGGGPTKGNIEYILEHRDAFAGAELKFSTPQAFFRAIEPARDRLPVVETELQRTFPGCYVVMADIKAAQRHGEHLLQQAQRAVERFAPAEQRPALHQRLDAAWEDLLFTQFHDVLAGTSIDAAWGSIRAMQGRARITGEEVLHSATRIWARRHLPAVNHQQIVLINPGDCDFDGFVQHEPFLDFDAWGDRWLADADGNPIPFQFTQPQSTIMLTPAVIFPAKVAAGAASVVILRDDPRPADAPQPPGRLVVSESAIGNDRLMIDLDAHGIARLRLDGRDLLGADGLSLLLREDTDGTWGAKYTRFDMPVTDRAQEIKWVVQDKGPLCASVRGELVLGRSPVRWTITLHHDRPEAEMRLDVRYIEEYRLMQLAAHLAWTASGWRGGLPGGAVARDADGIEGVIQGWSYPAAAADAAPTLALLSQEINSANVAGDHWSLALLRSTRMAWGGGNGTVYVGRDDFTDQGCHTFRLRLLAGPVPAEAILHQRATQLAQGLVVFDRYEGLNRPPWGSTPPRALWTPSEHRAHKDGKLTT